jgi:hypothetical protein
MLYISLFLSYSSHLLISIFIHISLARTKGKRQQCLTLSVVVEKDIGIPHPNHLSCKNTLIARTKQVMRTQSLVLSPGSAPFDFITVKIFVWCFEVLPRPLRLNSHPRLNAFVI